MMPIENIPDWDMRLKRQDAFWSRAILDRPVVHITLGRNPPVSEWPKAKGWKTVRERWMDTEHLAACAVTGVANTEYLGDALPAVYRICMIGMKPGRSSFPSTVSTGKRSLR